MKNNRFRRRDFLATSLASIATAPVLRGGDHPITAISRSDGNQPSVAQKFWWRLGSPVRRTAAPHHIGALARTADGLTQANRAPGEVLADPSRAPIFFFATDPNDSTTWKRANQVDTSKLLDKSSADSSKPVEDVTVGYVVDGVKLSDQDQERLGKIVNGSLRVDVGQAKPFGSDIGNLVWTAIAALLPGADSKLPQTQNVSFDPGTVWGSVSTVPLPGGSGSLLWNFFVNQKPSVFAQVVEWLKTNITPIGLVVPLLGLPGYVMTAFVAFNRILGAMPQSPTFLFQQQEWANVICTKHALNANILLAPDAIRLSNGGTYIVVPIAHEQAFFNEVSTTKYVIAFGRIVKPGDEQIAESKALSYLNDVTYATLTFAVNQGLG